MHQNMYVIALMLYLLTWITAAYQPQNFSEMKPKGANFFFPLDGNVYPRGYYTAKISIGRPPKAYVLDIDTGSDLTWLTCTAHHYDAHQGTLVNCGDPECAALGALWMNKGICNTPPINQYPCQYKINYADGTYYTGVLVKDFVHLKLSNGRWVRPWLAFGCGDAGKTSGNQVTADGVLGLGKGASSILTQLTKIGQIGNVVGHCLSSQGGGYLFFGEVDPLGITLKPMLPNSEHYSLGSANILLGGEATDIKRLNIIFDSGSTYTYLNSMAYEALLDLITRNVNTKLTRAYDDNDLPICWRGPFPSFDHVRPYFLPLALSFTDDKYAQFPMGVESYLIISKKKNVCLGILNGTEAGLIDTNVIGDISMQDKMVIYYNEHKMVGWDTCKKKF